MLSTGFGSSGRVPALQAKNLRIHIHIPPKNKTIDMCFGIAWVGDHIRICKVPQKWLFGVQA
jgi:hypothetical protein